MRKTGERNGSRLRLERTMTKWPLTSHPEPEEVTSRFRAPSECLNSVIKALVFSSIKETQLRSVSTISGCHKEIPYTGWLKQQKFMFFTVPEAHSPRSKVWERLFPADCTSSQGEQRGKNCDVSS